MAPSSSILLLARFTSLLLLCLPLVSAQKGDSMCRNAVCLSAYLEGDTVTYEMTATHSPVGYLAIGFGERMVRTHSVVMWKNDDGSTTLSQRYVGYYGEPRPVDNPPRVAKEVKPKALSTYPPHTTTFAFQVPANQSLLASDSPTEHLIYAFSSTRPEKEADSTIGRHSDVGYFSVDFTKDFKPSSALLTTAPKQPVATITMGNNAFTRNEKIMIIHAFLVSLGFMVLLPAGSLIARYGRAYSSRWFKPHWYTNMLVAGPVITLGALLGPVIVYNKLTFRTHLMNAHEICGILLLALYWTQVFLGRYIHDRRVQLTKKGPITRPHPPLNILHIIFGISIISLSFFQIRSGLQWWETLTGRGPLTPWAGTVWNIWIVLLPIVYFGGYVLLPRQLRQEREAAYAPLPVDNGNSAQNTHLLGEDDEST